MFGGLEIKAKKPEKAPAAEPAPAASSAFSFLNAATPAPAPAAPENPPALSSGFSFLNAAPEVVETPAPAPAAPAVSGFSFLQEPAPATTQEGAEADPTPPATSTNPAPAPDTVGSAFSFLATTSEPAPSLEAKVEEPVPEANDGANAAATSGFSFLSSPAPTTETIIPEPAAPPTITPSNPISVAFAPAAPSMPVAPAGAGISFGGAAATAARPKKKKSRAVKVGIGAASGPPTLPAPGQFGSSSLPAPSELPTPAEKPTTPKRTNSNTREDALDAARRAEEFMKQKLQEQTKAEVEAARAAEAAAAENSADAVYDDEMIAAAAAAAVEAQAMQKSSTGGALGIMGGLFRRSSPPTSSSNLNASAGSKPGSFSSGSRPPKPANIETVVTKPSSGNSLKSEDSGPPATSVKVTTATPAPPSVVQSPVPAMSSVPAMSFAPALPPKPAPKPQPPKPQTPEEKLNALLLTFRRDVEASMSKVTQMRQQRSRLFEERSRAMTQERLATQQRDLTEQQLTAAAEAEDFELADKLGSVLSSHENEQKECARMLEHIDLAIKQLDSQKQTVIDGVQKCFQNIQTQLQTFESTEESKENASDDTFSKKFATMTKHLAQEHERLENDLKHLERDEELVAEERKEVETAISEQSCEFEKQRDEAKEKLSTIDEEIEELRKQLEAKQVLATQLRNDIAGHEDSILQVRVQFARQLKRVQKKESTVQDHRKEWEAEKAKFQAEKDEHEAEVKAHSEALAAHEKLMASLKQEIAVAGTLEEIVQKEIGEADAASTEDDGDDDGGLLSLQAEVVKLEAAASEAKEVLKVATSTLESLETEMGMLIAKIPELEAIKKAAAAKRDFKAAGKASKEIKDATARVKECQEELTGEAVEKKDAAEKELKKLEEELKEKRQVALEKEKETGIVTMKKLAKRIQQLVDKKKEVCGEDSDVPNVRGIGAYVLEEQIKSLALEGQAYGEKYGGWEDLVAGLLDTGSTAGKEETELKADASSDEAVDSKGVGENSADTAAKEPEPTKPAMSKSAMKASFRRLSKELEDVEKKIEAAVEEEDFDLAAALDETLQRLMTEVGALDLTDAEMEESLLGDDGNDCEESPADDIAPSESAAESADAAKDDAGAAVETEGGAEKDDAEKSDEPTEEQPPPTSSGTADDEEEKDAVPQPEEGEAQPTDDTMESAAAAMIEEDLDEKKDADAHVDDGFVAVDDNDL